MNRLLGLAAVLGLCGSAFAQDAPAAAAPAASDAWVASVVKEEARLRAGPSLNFRVLERLKKGAWVVVTGTDGEFLRVRVPGGFPVFVSADLAEVGSDGKSVTVSRSDVLLRATAGQEYAPLDGQKLQKGDACVLLGREKGEKNDWLRVLPPARVECWLHKDLVERVAAVGEKAAELEKVALARRDAYTGGKEAEAAKIDAAAREAGYAATVKEAGAALAAAPAGTLPADAEARREALTVVMTESGDPATRAKAAAVSRDYAARERTDRLARAKTDRETVAGELERRLAEIEAEYQKRMEQILKAGPKPSGPKYQAIGSVVRNVDGTYDLMKGGVLVHRIESLRYDLDEMVDRRIGVNGTEVKVNSSLTIFRVDSIEILD
jgi:hypothetical protein